MRRFFSKLGFVHRRLWERDAFYRIALFFGPAPLLGAALAVIVWDGVAAVQGTIYQPPAWAHVTSSDNGSADAPRPASPVKPLPPLRADGSTIGYDHGWSITANAMIIRPTKEVDLNPTPIAGFSIDQPAVTMAQILNGGPKDKLFAAVSSGFLVIREAGTYGISVRFERPAGPVANCLVRLIVNDRRIFGNLNLDLAQQMTKDYPPAWFEFQRGLYEVKWVFGCWHDKAMSDLGQISVMLVEPGSHTARPLRATDIIR
jgi:hypothetical protein